MQYIQPHIVKHSNKIQAKVSHCLARLVCASPRGWWFSPLGFSRKSACWSSIHLCIRQMQMFLGHFKAFIYANIIFISPLFDRICYSPPALRWRKSKRVLQTVQRALQRCKAARPTAWGVIKSSQKVSYCKYITVLKMLHFSF